MPEFLFHPAYAWNLADELIRGRLVHEPDSGSYVDRMLQQGRSNGWISPANRQLALNMLVYADRALLPSDLDIHLPDHLRADRHIDWWGYATPNPGEGMPESRYAYQEISALAPALLEGRSSDDKMRFYSLLAWWKELHDWEERKLKKVKNERMRDFIELHRGLTGKKGFGHLTPAVIAEVKEFLRDDPYARWRHFDRIESQFRSELGFVRAAYRMTQHNIPSLNLGVNSLGRRRHEKTTLSDIDDVGSHSESALVRFYFDKIIDCPAPADLSSALRLRENQSVVAWREKVDHWLSGVSEGTITARDIRLEIEDANEYLGILKSPILKLSRFTPFFTIPVAILAKIAGLEGLDWALIGFEAAKFSYAEILPTALRSPDRLQHKWVMLSGKVGD